MTDSIESILPSIELKSFPRVRHFNASGMFISKEDNSSVHYKTALASCPKCQALDDIYNLRKFQLFTMFWCPGNLPPETEHTTLLGSTHKHQTPCAGVCVPHFHVKCNVCDNIMLLSMPEEDNG